MTKILRRIMESGGMTDDMEEDVRRLQDDLMNGRGYLENMAKHMTEKIETNMSLVNAMEPLIIHLAKKINLQMIGASNMRR